MNWNGWKIALEVKVILKGDFTSQASIGQLRAKARDVSRATMNNSIQRNVLEGALFRKFC